MAIGPGTIRGGDIVSLYIFSREFDAKSSEDITYHLGGMANETAVTTKNLIYSTQTKEVAFFQGITVIIDPLRGDYEALQEMVNSAEAGIIIITLAGGTTYSGRLVLQKLSGVSTNDGTTKFDAYGASIQRV